MKKVIVLGGGVAGMTAAHELAERGFEVVVYERRKDVPGGKARTESFRGSETEGRKPLPGEHGFRFFPGFYHHVPDTMRRIPFPGNRRGVFDNLVSCEEGTFAPVGKPSFNTLVRFPASPRDWTVGHEVPQHLAELGVTSDDVRFFLGKVLEIATSCKERRMQELGRIGWWDFIDASRRSPAYQTFLAIGMTRNAVATQAQKANACTIGNVGMALFLNMMVPGQSGDRVLNGPTNERWLDPWLAHLRDRLGVQYVFDATVSAIAFDGTQVTGVNVVVAGSPATVTADYYVCALPVEVTTPLLPPAMVAADPTLQGLSQLHVQTNWMTGIQYYLRDDVPVVKGHINCLGSPWALTAISQNQFWPSVDLRNEGDGTIRTILSVDISDWQAPGLPGGPARGKTAQDCTRDEVAAETWYQLQQCLNNGPAPVLTTYHSYWLDDDIKASPNPPHPEINLEPLLVNLVDTWNVRPDAYTRIPNFFLAGDYVRTHTDFASMEAANESGRRAANAILTAAGYTGTVAEIWDSYEPAMLAPLRAVDAARFEKGLPWLSPYHLPRELLQDAKDDVRDSLHGIAAGAAALGAGAAAIAKGVVAAAEDVDVLGLVEKGAHAVGRLFGRATEEDEAQAIIQRNSGRGIPVSRRGWACLQQWRDLLFMHWPLAPEALRPLVPEELEIDTRDGQAWISVVAMRMGAIRFPVVGTVPDTSRFPELNLRTYVRYGGSGGAYFLRIDAPDAPAELGARLFFHMPYGLAAMTMTESGDGAFWFASRRTQPATPDASLVVRYRPVGTAAVASPGSLETFLGERYSSFVRTSDGRILRGDLIRDPFAFQKVEVSVEVNTILKAAGLDLPVQAPALYYTPGALCVMWDMEDVTA